MSTAPSVRAPAEIAALDPNVQPAGARGFPAVRSGGSSGGLSRPELRPQLAKAIWFLGGVSLATGAVVGFVFHVPAALEISFALAALHALTGGVLWWTSLDALRALLPLALCSPFAFALIAQLTGGVESPGFRAMFLIPILGAVMLRGALLLPGVIAFSTLFAGTALILRSPKGFADAASWGVLLAISCFAAVFAAFHYRRLMAAETAWLSERNEALARLVSSERALALESLQRQQETAEALRQVNCAHAELQKAHELAVSQEKLAAIGTLAAGVAHEINNPMSFVTSNVGQLLAALRKLADPPAELREYVDEVLPETLEGIRRVNSIVADLRRFARGEPETQIEDYDLNEQVAFVVRMLRPCLDNGCKLELELGPLPPLRGWPRKIAQVVMNLILNAVQAVPGQGCVSVTTKLEGARAVVSVRDTGVGMSAETRARLFEPFFTTKPVGKGTGLGLSVSHGIIAMHGGYVEVDSEVGRGSCFTVHLPLASQTAEELEEARRSSA